MGSYSKKCNVKDLEGRKYKLQFPKVIRQNKEMDKTQKNSTRRENTSNSKDEK
jgi:hypothetical protein